jgi:hypothetical protein
MSIEYAKIQQRQDTLSNLNAIIREKFLAYNIDSDHLMYSKDGLTWISFYNSGEIDSKLALKLNATGSIDASQVTSGTFDVGRIPVLPSQIQITSSGDLTALTTGQQAQIGQGTIVTTTDGTRWVYTGTGTKTLAASYIILADVTPDWSVISNRPTNVSTWTNDATYITLGSVLTGFATGANSTVLATDSLLVALGKLQGQENNKLPLVAGSGSPLTGVLYGKGLNFTSIVDAPLTISMNLAGAYTHPFIATNSGMTAGQAFNFDFGQSESTANAANFGFVYQGAGSTSNAIAFGLYGYNNLLTITAAGLATFSGSLKVGSLSGTLIGTSGTVSALSGTNLVLGNGTTIAQSTFLTANQTITLSGDVTGSGTTSITTSIGSGIVTGKLLTGYSASTNSALAATDSLLAAFGKIQAQINARNGTVTSVALSANGPLGVSGSPITSSGTLSLSWSGSNTNFVRADGSTIATATYALSSSLSNYLPLVGGRVVGGLQIDSANTANDFIKFTSSSYMYIRGTAGGTYAAINATSSGTYGVSPTITIGPEPGNSNGVTTANLNVVGNITATGTISGSTAYLPLAGGTMLGGISSTVTTGQAIKIPYPSTGSSNIGILIGGVGDYASSSQAGLAIGMPSSAGAWPLEIQKAGVGIFHVDNNGAMVASSSITSGQSAMASWQPSTTNFAWFGHNSQNNNTSGNSGFLQANTGSIYMCAPTGQGANIQIGGSNIIAIANTGASVTGSLSASSYISGDFIYSNNNGNGTNYRVGDDLWIGDVNLANTAQLKGISDGTQAFLKFGTSGPSLGYNGSTFSLSTNLSLPGLSATNNVSMGGYLVVITSQTLTTQTYGHIDINGISPRILLKATGGSMLAISSFSGSAIGQIIMFSNQGNLAVTVSPQTGSFVVAVGSTYCAAWDGSTWN